MFNVHFMPLKEAYSTYSNKMIVCPSILLKCNFVYKTITSTNLEYSLMAMRQFENKHNYFSHAISDISLLNVAGHFLTL